MKFLLFALLAFFVACQSNPAPSPTIESKTILISKGYHKNTYTNWLLKADSNLVIHKLFDLEDHQVDSLLKLADGILISGGKDVNPVIYGKADQIDRCGPINPKRDSLEFKMIDYAFEHQIPLLGICRGEQIMNVSQGGTLVIDIPSDIGTDIVHRGTDSTKAYHEVSLVANSLTSQIANGITDTVRSSHHQAVEQLAPMFMASAYAPDSIIEAIELKNKSLHPFVLGLQWHPEKMNYENALSGCFAEAFIEAVRKN